MRKYYGITETISNTIYRVEIWDAPSGSAIGGIELPMQTPGFTLTYNEQGGKLWETQIQTSKIQAQFVVSDTADHEFFQNLAVEYEGNFGLIVYKNDVLFYVGRIIADQMQYLRRPEPNSVYTITAVDGLSQLDNFKIDKDWFDSTTKRVSILDVIRLSIAETFVPLYYTHLGFEDNYIMDLSKDLPTGSPGHAKILEFNLSSTIENLNNFINFNNDTDIYKDCETVIKDLLLVISSNLIYSDGLFVIYDPITVAENNFIFAFVYDVDGVYTSRPTINTQYAVGNAVRPCFSAFPIHTHQPPQKLIKQTYQRKTFSFEIYPFEDQPTYLMTATHKCVGKFTAPLLNVSAVVSFVSQNFLGITPPKQDFAEINFRIYVDLGGSMYRHYDYQTQEWSSPTGSIPFYESVRCNVSDYQVVAPSIATFTVDFNRSYIPPVDPENIVVDIAVGNIKWSWATGAVYNALSIWGGIQMFEEDSNPREITVSNSKNLKATEVLEQKAVYGYSFAFDAPNGIGTIWNSANDSASDVTLDDWARRQIAVYIDAPKVAQANLIDNGGYHPVLCPNFDDDSYAFNGGTFDAQNETWDFELLKIAQDVVNIDTSELDGQDEVDINDQQNNAVFRIVKQVETLRESISNTPNSLPNDIMRVSPDAPTSEPMVITNFVPIIKYDTATEALAWNIQELGRVQSLTGGTHDLDPTCELIICDATAENVIINLPDPATVKGLKYHFKKISSSHQVQLNGTIDGLGVYSFNGKDDCKVLMSDGTAYWLVAYYHK
jgi:hypothetical protein